MFSIQVHQFLASELNGEDDETGKKRIESTKFPGDSRCFMKKYAEIQDIHFDEERMYEKEENNKREENGEARK